MQLDSYKDETRRFFQKGQPLIFSKGDIIVGNDELTESVYYIGSGYVKAYSISDSGDEYLHLIYGSTELFPVIWAYLDTNIESVYYEAISDVSIWRVSKTLLREQLTSNPTLSFAIGRQMACQFEIYADRLDNLEYKKASERVIYRLLFLANRFGVKHGTDIYIDPPLTHESFANSINLARESVSRQLETLEASKLIKQKGRTIIIKDVEALLEKISRPNNFSNWRF